MQGIIPSEWERKDAEMYAMHSRVEQARQSGELDTVKRICNSSVSHDIKVAIGLSFLAKVMGERT